MQPFQGCSSHPSQTQGSSCLATLGLVISSFQDDGTSSPRPLCRGEGETSASSPHAELYGGCPGSLFLVGIDDGLELRLEGCKVFRPGEHDKSSGIGVAEGKHSVTDLLFIPFHKVADETQPGLAGHGPVFPTVG